MKWTLFKDELPECEYVYCSNYSDIWIRKYYGNNWNSWEQYAKEAPNTAWSPIEMPEIPVKPKKTHHCYLEGAQCFEINGKLIFDVKHNMPVEVLFCPYCGYKP